MELVSEAHSAWSGASGMTFPPAGRIGQAYPGRQVTQLKQPSHDLGSFAELDVSLDASSLTYWCMMRPERPSFSPGLLQDLSDMQASIRSICSDRPQAEMPIRYFVVGSHAPGIFNLGGDLTLFAALIRRGDGERLRKYARACIEVIHNNAVSYDLPIVTIAMVQGDALGGGFEAALSCNVIVAEKSAKFGLPEILFNLFPGMGAYSFLSRKIGSVAAEKMIMSGKIFSASELHEMGLVDVLVEDGEGPTAVREYIARHKRRHNAEQAIYRVRRRVHPVDFSELADVTDLWVEAALQLSESDLRKMERITLAQRRRWASHGTSKAV